MTLSFDEGQGIRLRDVAEDGTLLVEATGELDFASTRTLRRILHVVLPDRPPAIRLDLSRVTFCDSSTITTLLDIHRQALECACQFSIAPPDEVAFRVFRVTGTDDVLPFEHP